jgi:penicillin-binding protein 1B
LTATGEPLQRYPLAIEQVVESAPVFLLTTALQEAVRTGTGRTLSRQFATSMAVAGKTGTTDDLRDSWFAGYTGNYVAVVWVGRDNNLPTGLTGATGALTVWEDIIRRVHSEPLRLAPPQDVEFITIDPQEQRRTEAQCPRAVTLPFLIGSAPQAWASCARQELSAVEPQTPTPQTPVPKKPLLHWFRRIFR